jgi:hypothetical protein
MRYWNFVKTALAEWDLPFSRGLRAAWDQYSLRLIAVVAIFGLDIVLLAVLLNLPLDIQPLLPLAIIVGVLMILWTVYVLAVINPSTGSTALAWTARMVARVRKKKTHLYS